mmetsp:Transcript_7001/g.17938  ORF Transcript_7001/g.17938 Transcript_7001/m.17938 type:complete len:303 (-) Transcript_7001:888-1796(-)
MPQRRLARRLQFAGSLQLGGILLFIARFELGVPPGRALALLEGVLSGRLSQGPRKVVVSTVVRRRRVEPRQQRRLGERARQLVVGSGRHRRRRAQLVTTDGQLRRHEERRRRRDLRSGAARVVVVVLLVVALVPDNVVVVQRQERVGRLHEVVVHRPPPRRDGDLRAQALRGLHQRQEVPVPRDEHEPGLRGLLRVRPRRRLPVRLIAHELLGNKLQRAARDVHIDAGLAAAAHGVAPMQMRARTGRDAIAVATHDLVHLYAPVAREETRLSESLVELRRHRVDAAVARGAPAGALYRQPQR